MSELAWLILYAEGSFLNSVDNGYRCSCPSSSVKRERRMEIGEELRLEDQERRSWKIWEPGVPDFS